MKRRWILAFALIALTSVASAAPDGDVPRVEFPLGPYVRAGRPLDVRIVGGADRVRAPGTPWALPQGARGDEFILQLTDATVGVLPLEIERDGRVERVTQTVETLPADAVVVGVRGDGDVPAGARALRLPATGLPTVNEGWLLLDDGPDGVPRPFQDVGGWMRAERGFVEPMLLDPDPRPFVAMAEAADHAPRLPPDTALALMLLAVVEAALLGVLAIRRDAPWRRAAWLILPAVGALVFECRGAGLPGAIRADAAAVVVTHIGNGSGTALILVRVEARRAGRASFELPPADASAVASAHDGSRAAPDTLASATTSSAAVLRYGPDDSTVETVAAGRRVDVDLPAGQIRLFAYAVTGIRPSGPPQFESSILTRSAQASPRLLEWARASGFRAKDDGWARAPAWMLPRSSECVVIGGLQVAAGRPSPSK